MPIHSYSSSMHGLSGYAYYGGPHQLHQGISFDERKLKRTLSTPFRAIGALFSRLKERLRTNRNRRVEPLPQSSPAAPRTSTSSPIGLSAGQISSTILDAEPLQHSTVPPSTPLPSRRLEESTQASSSSTSSTSATFDSTLSKEEEGLSITVFNADRTTNSILIPIIQRNGKKALAPNAQKFFSMKTISIDLSGRTPSCTCNLKDGTLVNFSLKEDQVKAIKSLASGKHSVAKGKKARENFLKNVIFPKIPLPKTTPAASKPSSHSHLTAQVKKSSTSTASSTSAAKTSGPTITVKAFGKEDRFSIPSVPLTSKSIFDLSLQKFHCLKAVEFNLDTEKPYCVITFKDRSIHAFVLNEKEMEFIRSVLKGDRSPVDLFDRIVYSRISYEKVQYNVEKTIEANKTPKLQVKMDRIKARLKHENEQMAKKLVEDEAQFAPVRELREQLASVRADRISIETSGTSGNEQRLQDLSEEEERLTQTISDESEKIIDLISSTSNKRKKS